MEICPDFFFRRLAKVSPDILNYGVVRYAMGTGRDLIISLFVFGLSLLFVYHHLDIGDLY